jgi:hypothetical protein
MKAPGRRDAGGTATDDYSLDVTIHFRNSTLWKSWQYI